MCWLTSWNYMPNGCPPNSSPMWLWCVSECTNRLEWSCCISVFLLITIRRTRLIDPITCWYKCNLTRTWRFLRMCCKQWSISSLSWRSKTFWCNWIDVSLRVRNWKWIRRISSSQKRTEQESLGSIKISRWWLGIWTKLCLSLRLISEYGLSYYAQCRSVCMNLLFSMFLVINTK